MSNFPVLNFFDLVKILRNLIDDIDINAISASDLVDVHEQMTSLAQQAENRLFLMSRFPDKDKPGNLIWCFHKLFRSTNDNTLRAKAWVVLEPHAQADNDLFLLLVRAVKEDDSEVAKKIAEKMIAIGNEAYITSCLQILIDKPHAIATKIESLLTKKDVSSSV